jgi:hypothetical protein
MISRMLTVEGTCLFVSITLLVIPLPLLVILLVPELSVQLCGKLVIRVSTQVRITEPDLDGKAYLFQ